MMKDPSCGPRTNQNHKENMVRLKGPTIGIVLKMHHQAKVRRRLNTLLRALGRNPRIRTSPVYSYHVCLAAKDENDKSNTDAFL
jgi:hypothetical protein